MGKANTTRREVLHRLIAAPVLVGSASGAAGPLAAFCAAKPPDTPALAFPQQPMRLARVLTRDLRGGEKLQVTRDWQVKFADQNGGLAITGRQLSAHVNAPVSLAPMAKIEERRDTGDMFPILLSDSGIILAAGAYMRDVDLNSAVLKAQTLIAEMPIADNEKAQHRLFLAQLQRSGASMLDQMPPDLFFPVSDPVRSVQELSLPGGLSGEFEMNYRAFTRPGAVWLHRAMREVITRIGADERRSREEWTLEPMGDAVR